MSAHATITHMLAAQVVKIAKVETSTGVVPTHSGADVPIEDVRIHYLQHAPGGEEQVSPVYADEYGHQMFFLMLAFPDDGTPRVFH